MPKIVTLTPNPAIDLSTAVERVVPSLKLRCAQPRRDPGGGGVNVARVVKRLGGNVEAILPVGGLRANSCGGFSKKKTFRVA
jgi:6-phosphofructokinase 2